MITSAQFFDELARYLWAASCDAVYLFGELAGPELHRIAEDQDEKKISPEVISCPAWSEFTNIYEYAVQGFEGEDGPPLRRFFWDIIHPIVGAHTLPALLDAVVFLANARMVLDGHEPDLRESESSAEAGYLTVLQVAALADMDSRSVRNAMSSTRDDRLVGEQRGGRAVISVDAANKWLKGRRGFVPTTKRDGDAQTGSKQSTLSLPQAMVAQLVTTAAKEGISIEALLSRCLARESEES